MWRCYWVQCSEQGRWVKLPRCIAVTQTAIWLSYRSIIERSGVRVRTARHAPPEDRRGRGFGRRRDHELKRGPVCSERCGFSRGSNAMKSGAIATAALSVG